MKKKIRVGLLFGGRSSEHPISVASARSVFQHLDRRRYDVAPILIRRDGGWLSGPAVRAVLTSEKDEAPTRALARQADHPSSLTRLDVILPIFHGPYGEDGTLQGLLEMLGVPYVGSGVLASALAMDKMRSRALFRDAGLPVPKTLALTRPSPIDIRRTVRTLGLPLVIKPNRSGSSIGVTIVRHRRDVSKALRTAQRFDPTSLFEEFVAGRELTVPVLGGARSRALPVIEIIPRSGFFDLDAKYRGVAAGETLEVCPAKLPARLARQAQALALRAHRLLGCRGLTRTDFRLRHSGRLILLETNTMPGLTSESLAPKAIRIAGLSFDRLLDRLIRDALRDRRAHSLPL